jgi:OOP family OmpA-OmpF porin
MKTRLLAILPSLGVALVPTYALAAPEGEAKASVGLGGSTDGAESKAEASADGAAAEPDATAEADVDAKPAPTPEAEAEVELPKDRGHLPWIRRWGPERNMVEVGVFGGVFLPHPRLELFQADRSLENQGYKPFKDLSADVGGRLAYYPSRFLGLEFEGAVMPNEVDGEQATIFAVRGHLIANLIPRSITPFLLAGAGGMGVASRRSAVGTEMDAAAHFGGGLKFFLDRQTTLRLEARDNITARRGLQSGVVHSVEVLFGVSLALGRKKDQPQPPPPVVDTDGDGILDPDDKCVAEPGVTEYQGCPVPDTDGDGILDPDDKCVDEPGVVAFEGCPIPDTDGDGILDPDDECVDEPGVDAYKGCPVPDTDGDGVLDTDDKCIEEPETPNGFEDDDGCPDEIPKELEKFTGVIEGIYFDTGKATIKDKSKPKLDNAVEVLKKYEGVRLEISGHTDDRGSEESNQELSQRRADSVKQYFIDHGIGADRIETRGAGEGEPIESNKTRKGRAKNRRIEFKVLQ